MNIKTFWLILLSSYLRFASGQSQYYGSPNDYQYPSYSISYYSSYVIPSYEYLQYPGLTNTNLTNSSTNTPIVQQSSSILTNATNFIDIYTMMFIAMMIDMVMYVM